ncbi:MAG: hypothetical protein ACE15B_18040 [Bryobacteraceae bacterium]
MAVTPPAARRVRPAAYGVFLAVFGVWLAASHAPYLRLPFYWDELGQFVPAALDLFREGAWVPRTAAPNVHPPGLMAYLALVWSAAGYGIAVTRAAMLAVAAAAALFAFLLAIQLCREAPGRPAFAAAAFLCVSPLFFAQAMMAQLDMPAMLLTTVALLLFLQERMAGSIAACTALVLVKETGLIVPLVFAGWLWREGRRREALRFLLPGIGLAAWLAVLELRTGHLFGNREFTDYNLLYPLHPVRLAVTLARRLWYLFVGDFHWIGSAALVWAWRRTALFSSRAWRIAWTVLAAHVALLTVTGGAALERYLLPVVPILYGGFAAAMAFWRKGPRHAAQLALAAGLAAGIFWNPPYAFPLENNLAFTDFVRLHQAAADYVEARFPGRAVLTAWPLSAALARPEFGYVRRKLPVRRLRDFRRETLRAQDWNGRPVLILFNPAWQPRRDVLSWAGALRARFYNYEPGMTPAEVQAALPLKPAARWEHNGQWIEVYAAPNETFWPERQER